MTEASDHFTLFSAYRMSLKDRRLLKKNSFEALLLPIYSGRCRTNFGIFEESYVEPMWCRPYGPHIPSIASLSSSEALSRVDTLILSVSHAVPPQFLLTSHVSGIPYVHPPGVEYSLSNAEMLDLMVILSIIPSSHQ